MSASTPIEWVAAAVVKGRAVEVSAFFMVERRRQARWGSRVANAIARRSRPRSRRAARVARPAARARPRGATRGRRARSERGSARESGGF